jgi:cystathionine beta-lyase family protein involved in aluminum resistance
MITKLKVQIEEDKIIDEALKEKLEEKDRIIGNLEAKIVALRKDIQKKNMQNSSKVLDDIISCKKSHLDKSGLGYNQTEKDKLQNNRARNISKNLCRNNQRG